MLHTSRGYPARLELPFQSSLRWLLNKWISLPFHSRPSSPTRSKAERPLLILSCSGAMCVIGSRQSGPNTIVLASPTLWKQEKRENFLVHLLADRGQSSRLPTRNRLAD